MITCERLNELVKQGATIETEVWKIIPEFHGRYSVSNYGNIKSNDYVVCHNGENEKSHTQLVKGKTLKQFCGKDYCRIRLHLQEQIDKSSTKKAQNEADDTSREDQIFAPNWCRCEDSVFSMILFIPTSIMKVSLFRIHENLVFFTHGGFGFFAGFFENVQSSFILKQNARVYLGF